MNDDLDDEQGRDGNDPLSSTTSNSQQGKPSTRARRWLKRSGIAAGLAVLLLALAVFVLPTFAARWMLASTLEDLGLEATGVKTVEIDLWGREVSFGPIAVGVAGTAPVEVERFGLSFSGSQIFDRRGFGKVITIEGVSFEIVRAPDGQILLNGIDVFALAERFSSDGEPQAESEPWGVGVRSFELRNSVARFRSSDGREIDADIERLILSGFSSWLPEEPGQFSVLARVNDIDFELDGEAWPFSETIRVTATTQIDGVSREKIERFSGPLSLVQGEGALRARLENEIVIEREGKLSVSHDGRIEIQGLSVEVPSGPALHFDDADVTLKNMKTVLAPGSMSLSGSASITGAKARVTLSPNQSVQLDAVVLGLENVALATKEDRTVSGLLDAKLDASVGKVDLTDIGINFEQLNIVTDTLEFSQAPGTPENWSTNASLVLEKVEVQNTTEDGFRTAAFDFLNVQDVRIDQTLDMKLASAVIEAFKVEVQNKNDDGGITAAFESLNVEGARIDPALDMKLESAVIEALVATITDSARKEALQASFGKLSVLELGLTPDNALSADGVTVAGLDVKATSALLVGGETGDDAGSSGQLGQPTQAPQGGQGPSETAGLDIKLGSLRIADPAKVVLVDDRFSPATTVSLALETFRIENLDTSDPAARTLFSIATVVNEFTRLAGEGWIKGITDPSDFEVSSTLERLELPAFSPYAAKYLGLNLEKGRLTAAVRGNATDGNLDLGTDIEIQNLEFSPLSVEDAKRLSASTGVPVELAVDLLQDPNGLISLSIPIKGNINNPDFELSAVINKAMGNAIAGAVSTTLKLFFPPALLFSLVSSDGPGGGGDFASVPFDAGTTVLQADGQALLASLSKLVQERPRLTVTVCGRATSGDLRAVLAPDIAEVVSDRRSTHGRAMNLYITRLQPFVERGIVDSTGKILSADRPDTLPTRPEDPVLDEDAVFSELAAARVDTLRSSLTDLAAERTRAVRRALRELGTISDAQIAECRPVFDPADTAGPRAAVEL